MNDNQKRYQEYLNFVEKYKKYLGYVGDYKKHEIEMVFDINLFPQCEDNSANIMIKSGTTPEDAKKRAKIGIFDETRWGVSVHMPLRLPDGTYTTFNRWLSWGTLESGYAGVVIAPKNENGKFIFIKNFRNATRNWCLEFPRGSKDAGNSLLKTLKNELSEEMGAEIVGLPTKVGEVFPDSGVLGSRVEIFSATVKITAKAEHELTEAISGLVFLDINELKTVLLSQKYVDKDGKEFEFKDGYTLSALQLIKI